MADLDPFVINEDTQLPTDPMSALCELELHCRCEDMLEKPKTKGGVNREESADDRVRQLIVDQAVRTLNCHPALFIDRLR